MDHLLLLQVVRLQNPQLHLVRQDEEEVRPFVGDLKQRGLGFTVLLGAWLWLNCVQGFASNDTKLPSGDKMDEVVLDGDPFFLQVQTNPSNIIRNDREDNMIVVLLHLGRMLVFALPVERCL
jgi:hypothetical protein